LNLDIDQARSPGSTLNVRTRARPESVMPLIRLQWEQFAAAVPLIDIRTGLELVDVSLAPQRAAAALFSGFALLAILLASIGLYGAMAHSVAQRTREIGLRIAIGASPQSVIRRILSRAMAWTAAGIAAGAVVSWLLTRLMASQLRSVSPHDPATYFGVAVLVAVVAAVSAWIPARRAARIDPVTTLRWE
jgi:ABC-type antimicrobial peptide transport system permease subunit